MLTLLQIARPGDEMIHNQTMNAGQNLEMTISQHETAGKGDRP